MAVTTADGFKIPISLDDKASPGFKKMERNSKKLISQMGNLGSAVVVVNQAFELMGKAMRAGNAIFNQTLGNFAEFEDALIGVGKTANLAGAELASLGQDFQMMSERIPRSAAELASVAKVAGQLGVQGSEDILRFTETMAKLESASNLAGETGASQVARILNIVEGGVGNVDRFGASIVALGNNFAATEAEISHMATEVARSTAVFKPSSAQVLGMSTAMKALGIQSQLGGSVVGRAMREMQAAIQSGAGQGRDALSELTGIVGTDLKDAFETDATAVFQKFIEGLGAMDPSEITSKLEDLGLKGDEVLKVLPVLATRSELVGKALDVANKGYEENVALNEEAAKAFKSFSSEMKLLGNQINNIATDIGAELAPKIIELVKLFREELNDAVEETKRVFEAFSKAINKVDFGKLTENVELFAGVMAGLLALFNGPAIIGFAIVAAKAVLIAAAFIAIASAIEVLILNFDKIGLVGELLTNTFVKVEAVVRSSFSQLVLFIVQKLTQMAIAIGQAFPDFSEAAVTATETLTKIGDSLVDTVIKAEEDSEKAGDAISENLEAIGKDFKIGTFAEGVKSGLEFLEDFNKELDKTSVKGKAANDAMEFDFESGDFEKDAPVGGGGGGGPDVKGTLFTDEDLTGISAVFGEGAAGIASAASSMLAVPMAMVAAANVIVDAVQGLVDAVPDLLNKVADLFTSLTELPQKIVEAVINVFSAFGDLVGNILSNIVNGITDLLFAVVDFFVSQLPEAIQSIIEKLPEAIMRLFEQLPTIIQGLIFGLITSLVDIFVILPIELIKAVPKIVIAFIKMIPLIVVAFVDGIVDGLKSAINAISESLGLGEIFDMGNAVEQFEEIGDKIAKSSSQLFSVVDLEASQRGLDLADKIRNAITSSGKAVGNIFTKLWGALTDAWMWVMDNIVDPLINGITAAWMWIRNNIVDPLVNGIREAWEWARENFIDPLLDGLEAIWNFVIDNVVKPVLNAFVTLFDGLGGIIMGIVDAFKALFSGDFSGITEALTKGFKIGLDAITKVFGLLINPIIDLFNSLKLPKVAPSGEIFGKKFSFTLIPAIDLIPGPDIPRIGLQNGGEALQTGGIAGTDTVDASLTPGEFVVNRESTRANLNLLKSINNAKGSVGGSTGGDTTISVVINTKTNLDKSAIRREIMPELKKELKKESQRGVFIISQRGVRA